MEPQVGQCASEKMWANETLGETLGETGSEQVSQCELVRQQVSQLDSTSETKSDLALAHS